MAIFSLKSVKPKQKQKILIAVFIVSIVVISIIWLQFFNPTTVIKTKIIAPQYPQVNMDFKTLENPLIKQLKPFIIFPPFLGKLGRENPFLPY